MTAWARLPVRVNGLFLAQTLQGISPEIVFQGDKSYFYHLLTLSRKKIASVMFAGWPAWPPYTDRPTSLWNKCMEALNGPQTKKKNHHSLTVLIFQQFVLIKFFSSDSLELFSITSEAVQHKPSSLTHIFASCKCHISSKSIKRNNFFRY